MIDPPPLMAGTDQSRQNMWRKMLNYAVHRNVPGACATYWSAPHTATACQVACPLHGSDWDAPALGDFYNQAFSTLLVCGLILGTLILSNTLPLFLGHFWLLHRLFVFGIAH